MSSISTRIKWDSISHWMIQWVAFLHSTMIKWNNISNWMIQWDNISNWWFNETTFLIEWFDETAFFIGWFEETAFPIGWWNDTWHSWERAVPRNETKAGNRGRPQGRETALFNNCRVLCTWEVQCCRSVTFCYGFGSVDPYLWITDPDSNPEPAIFVSDL